MKDRELYSVTEARELLGGICRNTIYTLMNTGELTSVVIGCRRFISKEAIDALIAKSTTKQGPAIDPARFRKSGQTGLLPLPPLPDSGSASSGNNG